MVFVMQRLRKRLVMVALGAVSKDAQNTVGTDDNQ